MEDQQIRALEGDLAHFNQALHSRLPHDFQRQSQTRVGSHLSEERRLQIQRYLEKEREMRRQAIAEGRPDFQLSKITSDFSSPSLAGMRDPNQILLQNQEQERGANSPSALSFSSPGDTSMKGGQRVIQSEERRELVSRMLQEHKRKKLELEVNESGDTGAHFPHRDTSSNEVTARVVKKEKQNNFLMMPDPSQIYNTDSSFQDEKQEQFSASEKKEKQPVHERLYQISQKTSEPKKHNFRPSSAQGRDAKPRMTAKDRMTKSQKSLRKLPEVGKENRSKNYMKSTITKQVNQTVNDEKVMGRTMNLIQKADQEFKKTHTFQPKINATSKETKPERWNRLITPKADTIQQRERIKALIEADQVNQHCTFHPQINETSVQRMAVAAYSRPVQERLYAENDRKIEQREKLRRLQEEKEYSECTFKPEIKRTSSTFPIRPGNNSRPIHERLDQIQKSKNQKLQRLRMEQEFGNENLSFKPIISETSKLLVDRKQNEKFGKRTGVVDRMVKDANERIEKTYHRLEEKSVDYPFTPNIGATNQEKAHNNSMFKGNFNDFIQRQQAFQSRQSENIERNRILYGQESGCTFAPEINLTSDIIIETDPKRGKETMEDRIKRLSTKDAKKKEVIKELLEQEYYQNLDFKPKINKVSKTLAKTSSINELAYNKRGEEVKSLLEEKRAQEELKECTFQPQLVTREKPQFRHIESKYKSGEENIAKVIKEEQEERQEWIEQERRNKEYDEIKDCTFKPRIKNKVGIPGEKDVVVVRGLSRHLELREMKQRQEQERKEREQKVFGYGQLSRNQEKAYTVPEPFRLSYVSGGEKLATQG